MALRPSGQRVAPAIALGAGSDDVGFVSDAVIDHGHVISSDWAR
jgi:hypothetical protein